MKQVQLTRRRPAREVPDLDLRTPSGRILPY
jgi:hypothetical protein